MKAYVMNTLVIVLIAAVLLSAAYVLYGRWLANKWGIDPKAETPQRKNLRMERGSTRSCMYRCCTGTYSLDAVARIGYANIWPLFGSANQLLSALVERTIGLVKAYFKAQKESA